MGVCLRCKAAPKIDSRSTFAERESLRTIHRSSPDYRLSASCRTEAGTDGETSVSLPPST